MRFFCFKNSPIHKATLFHELESRVVSTPPDTYDVLIVDGFYVLHLLVNVPSSYGNIAKQILRMICRTPAKEIHLVFDTHKSPSIKDIERQHRCAGRQNENTYKINGSNQQRSAEFSELLKNDSFKNAFVDFLTVYFETDEITSILGNKQLYVTNNTKCFLYESESGVVQKTEVDNLRCLHEEADTRMVYHIFSLSSTKNIVVKANDTDVLIILLANVWKLNINHLIWMNIKSNNYVDVSSLAAKLGQSLCLALPALHALTGCDYTAAFNRKGKIKPLKLLEQHDHLQKSLGMLGSSSSVPNSIVNDVEEFICLLYGVHVCSSVNEARLRIFDKICKPKSQNKFKNLKGNKLKYLYFLEKISVKHRQQKLN
jgi:hypothetical protein